MIQHELQFNSPKEAGIQRAVKHADRVHQGWSEEAFEFLTEFVRTKNVQFIAEDVSDASVGEVPQPPTKKAWGAVMLRAARVGLIRKIGYGQAQGKQAHSRPVTIWRRNNNG